ncbi:MAG: UbiA family prenyltransferase [Holophagales bacterium]|nr:UbiA family prenyltransferase [Holophagales bacterium]
MGAIALGSLCASFLNAASNALNQITDLEVDRVNKPDRPLVTGEAGIRETWVLTWVLYVLAMVPVWFVVVPPREGIAARLLARFRPTRPSSSSSAASSSRSSTRCRRGGGRSASASGPTSPSPFPAARS